MRIGSGVPVNCASNHLPSGTIAYPENPAISTSHAPPDAPSPQTAPPQRCSNCANRASNSWSLRKFCGPAGRQCSQHPASRSSKFIAASIRSCDDGLPAYNERSSIRARCSKLKSICTRPTLHVWGMASVNHRMLYSARCRPKIDSGDRCGMLGILTCVARIWLINPTQSPPTSVE